MSIGLQMGFAEAEFTPEPGLDLFGQMHRRIAQRVRDPLMACAVAITDGDGPPVVIVAADVCVLGDALVRRTRSEFADRTGVQGDRLLIHATHTHVAPATESFMAAHADPGFIDRLCGAMVEASATALDRLASVTLTGGEGRLDCMGWNRRAMFADGSSAMYGHAGMPGFEGMEGPRDPTLAVLAARRDDGRIAGAIVNFSTHPNALEGESFYSADIPGEVRRLLKGMLEADALVYLIGAAGNTAPSILDTGQSDQPWRGEEGLRRSGLYVAGEAAKVFAACTEPLVATPVRLVGAAPCIPLRPWPRPDEANFPEPLRSDAWPDARRYYEQSRDDWPRRLAEENPEPVRLNVLRIGDAMLCTNPAELFVEHGLAIRRTSPAQVTLIAQLTDGYVGYVPTRLAFSRGGYETWPAPSSRLAPEAGETIVAETCRLMKLCRQ